MRTIHELLEDARVGKFDRDEILALNQQQSKWDGGLLGDPAQSVRAGTDEMGNTLLHYATYWDNLHIADDLMRCYASAHQPNNAGDTSFDIAERGRAEKTGRWLTMHWNLLAHSELWERGLADQAYNKGLNEASGAHGSKLIHYAAMWSPEYELEKHLSRQRPLSSHFEASRIGFADIFSGAATAEEMSEAMEEADPDTISLYAADNNGWTMLHAAAATPGRSKAVEMIATYFKEKAPEYLTKQTTSAYSITYRYPEGDAEICYPAGATAQELIDCRLEQDRFLSATDKEDLQKAKATIADTLRGEGAAKPGHKNVR